MRFTNKYKADSWAAHKYKNYILINNASSWRDRPHNIGITTLLFTIDVHGFFQVPR